MSSTVQAGQAFADECAKLVEADAPVFSGTTACPLSYGERLMAKSYGGRGIRLASLWPFSLHLRNAGF
ncbi:MAG TPA: hypothetical protein VFQ34_01810, partial [Nitrospiraceae bacterium]|nr:hypothetical protein [Nitrospiraceae bacterium]